MATHTLHYLADSCLRAPTEVITDFDSALQILVADMFETMYQAHGVGLAAPQIGISKKIAVIDVSSDRSQTWCLINPEILSMELPEWMDEGCLSIPGAYDKVQRASKVTLKALDQYGKPYEVNAEGLLAQAIQHEVDHINGKLFIDHLSPLKRQMAKKKYEKTIKREGQT